MFIQLWWNYPHFSAASDTSWYIPILRIPMCWWQRIQGESLIPLRSNLNGWAPHTSDICVSHPHYPITIHLLRGNVPTWVGFSDSFPKYLVTCQCRSNLHPHVDVSWYCQSNPIFLVWPINHHFSWWNGYKPPLFLVKHLLFWGSTSGSQGPYAKHVAVEISTSMLGALRCKARLAARWKRRPQ